MEVGERAQLWTAPAFQIKQAVVGGWEKGSTVDSASVSHKAGCSQRLRRLNCGWLQQFTGFSSCTQVTFKECMLHWYFVASSVFALINGSWKPNGAAGLGRQISYHFKFWSGGWPAAARRGEGEGRPVMLLYAESHARWLLLISRGPLTEAAKAARKGDQVCKRDMVATSKISICIAEKCREHVNHFCIS